MRCRGGEAWVAGVLAVALVVAWAGRAQAAVRVVATVPDLAALAREVGGDAVTVKSLTSPAQDPHFADAKPSLALELNRAQLLLHVGLELEIGWLPNLLVGARNGAIQPGTPGNLDCSQFVKKLDVATAAVDRSHGDIHPTGNPHYSYDPRAASAVAAGIAERLATLDPAHAQRFRDNYAAWKRRLDAARTRWEKRLASARGTPFISYHKTWVYVADWLGFDAVGYLEPKPGLPPNPRHVAQLLVQARVRKVKLVLQEDYYPDATSKEVATRIPAPLVRVPAQTNVATGESYLQHLDLVLDRIATALEAPR